MLSAPRTTYVHPLVRDPLVICALDRAHVSHYAPVTSFAPVWWAVDLLA